MNISWRRQNFRGREVSLLGGATLGLALTGLHGGNALRGDKASARVAVAAMGGSAAGFFDDMSDKELRNKSTKGLHGHLGALKEGRVSPGLIKMLALVLTGFLASKPRRNVADWGVEAAIISGTANLVNLMDLRPGRALKTAVLLTLAGLMPSRNEKKRSAYGVRCLLNLSAIAAAFPLDLREVTMLGDTGANALGASLGATWVENRGRKTKLAVLAGIVALTVLSEKISFSKVIQRNSFLKFLDDWGRLKEGSAASETTRPNRSTVGAADVLPEADGLAEKSAIEALPSAIEEHT